MSDVSSNDKMRIRGGPENAGTVVSFPNAKRSTSHVSVWILRIFILALTSEDIGHCSVLDVRHGSRRHVGASDRRSGRAQSTD